MMGPRDVLKVKNHDKYQHYKKRNPPWIKLYRSTLGDYGLRQVSVPARLVFFYMTTLASETDNRVPNDTLFLSERFGFKVTKEHISELIREGFVLASGASNLLAYDALCSDSDSSSLNSPKEKRVVREKRMNGHALEVPIPEDWTPTDSHGKQAAALHLDLGLEANHFKGRAQELEWRTKNWNLKFTNWVLQEGKFRQRRPS